ncbi:MAG: hypothetical protein WBV82_27950 [Myxococcaceae bacterium]
MPPNNRKPDSVRTPQMKKIMTAIQGDDEFSVFSVSDAGRKKSPVEMNPRLAEKEEEPPASFRLLQFFRGFIRR